MAEEQHDVSTEGPPRLQRAKGKARADSSREDAELGNIWKQDAELAETSAARIERSEQQTKERKKPRKLERRSVVLEEPVVTLDTRVDRLETQFQALSSRVDAVEVRQVRRGTASSYRRSSSTSTRATSGPRQRSRTSAPRATSSTARPSLADQLRESQRLRKTAQRHKSSETIEEIPRSALTTASSQSRQVALTGQYNIPLPPNLTTEDIQNLKSGLTAAGSIARSLATALTSSRGNGSGTATPTTPRGGGSATATAAGAGTARSAGTTIIATASADHQNDGKVQDAAGGRGGNRSASSVPAGNHQPEVVDKEDVAPENQASASWRSFISDCGRVVASAARDAAVEIQHVPTTPAGPAEGVLEAYTSTEDAGAVSTRRKGSSSRVRRGQVVGRETQGAEGNPARSAPRSRPITSRTSSRASS